MLNKSIEQYIDNDTRFVNKYDKIKYKDETLKIKYKINDDYDHSLIEKIINVIKEHNNIIDNLYDTVDEMIKTFIDDDISFSINGDVIKCHVKISQNVPSFKLDTDSINQNITTQVENCKLGFIVWYENCKTTFMKNKLFLTNYELYGKYKIDTQNDIYYLVDKKLYKNEFIPSCDILMLYKCGNLDNHIVVNTTTNKIISHKTGYQYSRLDVKCCIDLTKENLMELVNNYENLLIEYNGLVKSLEPIYEDKTYNSYIFKFIDINKIYNVDYIRMAFNYFLVLFKKFDHKKLWTLYSRFVKDENKFIEYYVKYDDMLCFYDKYDESNNYKTYDIDDLINMISTKFPSFIR